MKKTLQGMLASLLCALLLTTAAITASAKVFPDVAPSSWYAGYVTYMSEKGIITGYDDGTFGPKNQITRAEFITMITRTFGLKPSGSVSFSDVKTTNWFYDSYRSAAAEGFLTEVFKENEMKPNVAITREEATALLMAYLDYPEDERSESSAYLDYFEINKDYRDYIMQATAANIVNGYDDDKDNIFEFKPKGTLERSHASKILSVAAGTIANRDVNGIEFSESENLTVTKSCVVKNISIGGNVIISSGVEGTVTFTNCDIAGTVSNRSTAKVVFSGCNIGTVDLDTPYTSVDLKQSEIDNLNILGLGAKVEFFTQSKVQKLSVKSGSSLSKVLGSGRIDTLEINAGSFSSSIIPTELKLTSGFSATIGNELYEDGFKNGVSTYWSSSNEYIQLETYVNGTVRYYFTKSSYEPAANAFNALYSIADVKGSFSVTADRSYSGLLNYADVEASPYIVIALFDGNTIISSPILINREASKYGFTVSPTLSTSGSSDTLSFTPSRPGTLYYYYTHESATPSTFSTALNYYSQTDGSLRGTIQVTYALSTSQVTKPAEATSDYAYCVVFYTDSNDNHYTPISVERPYTTNGLSSEPYVIAAEKKDDRDILTITPSTGGQLRWFYTNSTANFTSSLFDTEYYASNSEIKGYQYLYSDTEAKVSLAKKSDAENYKYVIIEQGSNAPIKLQKRTSVTGFDVIPVVMKTEKEDLIAFDAIAKDGTVYYMYVGQNKQFSSEAFMDAYTALADKYKGSVTTDGNSQNVLSVEQSKNISYAYVVFMFRNDNGEHLPVTVKRNEIGNGFTGTPAVEFDTDTSTTSLILNANAKYDIQYFETNSYYSGDALVNEFTHRKTNNGLSYIRSAEVSIGTNSYNLNLSSQYKYIAIRASYGSDVLFTPVLITVKTIDDGLKPLTNTLGSKADIKFGYSGVNDSVTIVSNPNTYGGVFNYYYSKTEPKSEDDYNKIFSDTTILSGSIELNQSSTGTSKISFNTIRSSSIVDCGYLVYRVIDVNGKSMTPGYVVIPDSHRQRATVSATSPTELTLTFGDGEEQKFTVKWFYSTEQIKDITSSSFSTNYYNASYYYSSTVRYSGLENNVQGTSKGTYKITTKFQQATGSSPVYKYIYVMLTDASNKDYMPIEIAVPDLPNT